MFFFFLRTVSHFLIKFCRNVLGITMLVTTHTEKIAVWPSLLGIIWGYFWAYFDVCSYISREPFSISLWHFIRSSWHYSDCHYTKNNFSCHILLWLGHCGFFLYSFWSVTFYFLRLAQYFFTKFCTDVLGITLTVNTLKMIFHAMCSSARGHFGVFLGPFWCVIFYFLIPVHYFFAKVCIDLKNLYGPFLWIVFNCLKATERLWWGSFLFTNKSLQGPGLSITLIVLVLL